MTCRIIKVLLLLVVLSHGLFGADEVAGNASGPWRRLFLDAMVVERSEGLTRVFHAARKHEQNPVLPFDKPWEGDAPKRGSGPYLYGTVMRDGGRLRMWYHCYHRRHGAYFNLYAESTDGIHWDKPALGLVEFEGSRENNLIITKCAEEDVEEPELHRGGGRCHNPSVIKRPGNVPADRRYVLYCYGQDYRHSRMAYSPDGLSWDFVKDTARNALFPSGDVLNFFFDPYHQRYVATRKSGNRRGRAAGVAWSRNGTDWETPLKGPVMIADDLDPDATQIYGMPVFPYQGLYIGLPWVYNARWFKNGSYTDQWMYEAEKSSPRTMDAQFAWSWDLINWTRPPERRAFIPRGEAGEFDCDMIYTARAPVQMGDELWFYYGGFTGVHSDSTARSAIGLAKLRLDGFCSLQAGKNEGMFVSRRETLMVPRVTINAQVRPGGHVAAEILDLSGGVIPGFSRSDCVPFRGDDVRHVLTWKNADFPVDGVTEDKKIRFVLKEADIYSYMPDLSIPAAAIKPVTVIYDASAEGAQLPNDKSIPAGQRFTCGGPPAGYSLATDKETGEAYLDLYSKAERGGHASCSRNETWTDDIDWCLETWLRVADKGDEPNYGLAIWMRPEHGHRGVALYLSDAAVGFNSTLGPIEHKTLRKIPFDTTDAFHWYRMVHEGGAAGDVVLFVDGKELCRIPMSELYARQGGGRNILFGPNAARRTGRIHVMKFGYRIASTDAIFGPLP
ncbi:MAG: hypothetical protein HN742_30885 [Lentisphaerae bacterium]|jgi:hypothetical protein|nr:hypothetical protein [Lentisphaerota bacterium]MBT4822295.1 hypothetical protein [Lentisphaerota bacterium]MBT5607953.1 hypothetical protein [Lentisphaerota bacterium]MBT7056527.1 hypothetical protein [Lentisphaerota bacterium]MBT7846318.1 hypothetical protein [Lentisphaerota bacterium]